VLAVRARVDLPVRVATDPDQHHVRLPELTAEGCAPGDDLHAERPPRLDRVGVPFRGAGGAHDSDLPRGARRGVLGRHLNGDRVPPRGTPDLAAAVDADAFR